MENNYSQESIEFFLRISNDVSRLVDNRHSVGILSGISQFGQGAVQGRIKYINGEPISYDTFRSDIDQYLNNKSRGVDKNEYNRVEMWKIFYLPKIMDAMKNDRIEFVGYD